jgi:hypothetical protein
MFIEEREGEEDRACESKERSGRRREAEAERAILGVKLLLPLAF